MSVDRQPIRTSDTWSPLERAAAEWVVRLRDGLSAPEQAELDRWLAADSSHAGMFVEMQETLRLLRQLRDAALRPTGAPPGAANQGRTNPLEAGKRRRPSWLPLGVAAAVVLGIATMAWRSPARESFLASAATDVGDLRVLELPDGSIVHLNTNSALAIAYSPDDRHVRLLRGEAFFTVARDGRRPFCVIVGDVAVQAIGTAFNVRCRNDAVEVLVSEGWVSVALAVQQSVIGSPTPGDRPRPASPDPQLLVAGQKAVLPSRGQPASPSAPAAVAAVDSHQIRSILAWQSRRLEFSDIPLADVVAEFNRYNQHRLRVEDPELAQAVFGGAFAANGYEALVEILVQSFGVSAERRHGETILRLRQ